MNEAASGSGSAAERMLPLVYEELRQLAAAKLRHEPSGLTLDATALVHEAFLRLGGSEHQQWRDRRHYFAAAAEAMRRILIERARRVAGPKAGGGRLREQLTEDNLDSISDPDKWLSLDEGLSALSRKDPELAEVVSLKFFAGLTVDQIAAALDVSPRTVDNHWRVARSFLLRHVSDARSASGDGG